MTYSVRAAMRAAFAAIAAVAMTAALSGCAQSAKQEESPADEAPAAIEPTGLDEGASASAEAPAASAAEPAASDAAPKINLGELNLLDVHETDEGIVADAVLEVINTGDAPIALGTATISIFDENGEEVLTASGNGIFTGPSYLRPGDVGFLYTNSPFALPEGCDADGEYGLTGGVETTVCEEVWEYPVTDLALTDDGYGVPMVTGTVTNDDSRLAELIEITVVFLDNEHNMLGVASDVVMNLEPGTSTDFSIDGYTLPVGCTMAVIADYDALAVAPVWVRNQGA